MFLGATICVEASSHLVVLSIKGSPPIYSVEGQETEGDEEEGAGGVVHLGQRPFTKNMNEHSQHLPDVRLDRHHV